ncbi:DUF4180 domain-containing protein [Embleya sp. NPDC005971]|uniref:DUF4180 domain-containing protein n=1 Tax=unclassified Embleya TaxID=2699296 RepID=UPI0033E9D57A
MPDRPDAMETLHDTSVWICAAEGTPIRTVRDTLDLIGEAGYRGASWVVLPAARLDPDFFRLRTGVAGDVLQKFADYRMRVAILGDITEYTAASEPLTDFVRECNRGRHVWFGADLEALTARLAEEGLAG